MLLPITLITLATYRLAADYTQEHGPFGLYYRLRKIMRRFAETRINNSTVNDPADHWLYWLYDGAACFHCASFWLALALTLLATFLPKPASLPLAWPALLFAWLTSAGLASALYRLLDALSQRQSATTKEEFQSWLNQHLGAGSQWEPASGPAAFDQQQSDQLANFLSSTEPAPPPP